MFGIKKIDKQSLLAGITFAVLICLMVIQLLFLFKASKLEERNFNHRAVLALRESRNEIAREAKACNYMHNYVCGKQCSSEMQFINFHKVDSILKSNFLIHQIKLDYKFEFINELQKKNQQLCITCYEQSLNGLLEQNGIKLLIEFPNHSKFLYAQMGVPFYLSILAILFVMISFIFTSRLFRREKAMLHNTKDFIDNMVHEFQTPISNIKFATNLIRKNTAVGEHSGKVLDYTGLILSENKKMQCHVEDILKVATMVSENKMNSVVDMHALINDCVEFYRPALAEMDGVIHVDLKADHFLINGQYTYLRHALSNLLDNALKYNQGNPIIRIKTFTKKNGFYLAVSDNGIGILAKDCQNIFQKYYRVPTGNIHDVKGFGIGLDFVKKVVDSHHGDVVVKSEINKGSTFTLKFKLRKSADE